MISTFFDPRPWAVARFAALLLTSALLSQTAPAAPRGKWAADESAEKVRDYKAERAKIKVKHPKGVRGVDSGVSSF